MSFKKTIIVNGWTEQKAVDNAAILLQLINEGQLEYVTGRDHIAIYKDNEAVEGNSAIFTIDYSDNSSFCCMMA